MFSVHQPKKLMIFERNSAILSTISKIGARLANSGGRSTVAAKEGIAVADKTMAADARYAIAFFTFSHSLVYNVIYIKVILPHLY